MTQDDSSTATADPGQVQSLVNAQNAAMANPKFAPNTPSPGVTHCSESSFFVAQQVGAKTDGILGARGENFDANTQIQNLANPANGYAAVTPDQAQDLANQGIVAFATQVREPHGHIASVRPQGVSGDNPTGLTGPLLANVGLFNGVAHQSMVFTPAHGAIVYYAPNSNG